MRRARLPLGLMTWTVCALALGSVALAACASREEDPDVDHTIEGTVRDDFNGHELAGATVRFVSDALDETEVTSDGNGRYSMTVNVTAGVSFGTLHAEKAGYQSSLTQSVYFDGTERTVDLRLRPKGD